MPTSHRRVTRTDFDTHACLKKSPRARPLTHARTEALYLASLQARGSKHFFLKMAHKGRSARRLGEDGGRRSKKLGRGPMCRGDSCADQGALRTPARRDGE